VVDTALTVADVNISILITGEAGTAELLKISRPMLNRKLKICSVRIKTGDLPVILRYNCPIINSFL